MQPLATMLNWHLILYLPFLAHVWSQQLRPRPSVHTRNGTIHGRYLSKFDQELFLGIPFANAPRLANPTPLNSTWNTPFDASASGPACYGFGSNILLNLNQSEDCLNLNVVRPARRHGGDGLPVLLWIYGGGFTQGANSDPMWNLSYIVQQSVRQKQPILAISINYRLSFLGFPGGQESLDAGSTNLGLKDQRMALRWAQENVDAFGGDPSKVTIWGESAGGISVATQLVAYGGKGGRDLFRAGILVSGFSHGVDPVTVNSTQAGYNALVSRANCTGASNTLACLRSAPLSAIYPIENSLARWGHMIDGDLIRRPPAYEVADGNIARVPILLGSNSDEGLFYVNAANFFPNTTAELVFLMKVVFPAFSDDIITNLLDLYPLDGPAPPYSLPADYAWCAAMNAGNLACGAQYRRAAALFGDFFAHAPRRYMASHWAQLGLAAYSFRFDTAPTALPIVYWNGLGPGFAEHGAELAYEFGLPPGFTTSIRFYPPVKNISTHIQMSQEMIKRWIAFTYTGDPNSGLPQGESSCTLYNPREEDDDEDEEMLDESNTLTNDFPQQMIHPCLGPFTLTLLIITTTSTTTTTTARPPRRILSSTQRMKWSISILNRMIIVPKEFSSGSIISLKRIMEGSSRR